MLSQGEPNVNVCLFPSTELLFPAMFAAMEGALHLGAQTCSMHDTGAYTGQVSPVVLREFGCGYCLVGHSEVREAFGETDQIIAKKALALAQVNIVPIICVGEKEQTSTAQAAAYVQAQLEPVIATLRNANPACEQIIIAYEPTWAIGTDTSAPVDHIHAVSDALHEHVDAQLECKSDFVYGGSVHERNIEMISNIKALDGVLVGRASTNFQTARKMIELLG